MANPAGTTGLHVALPTELVEAFRTKADENHTGVTALIRGWIEKYLGQKPSKVSRKPGRPKKVE